MFKKLDSNDYLSKDEIFSTLNEIVIDVIDKNIPYHWYITKEPFINQYNGKISYDYSGDVEPMTKELLDKVVLELEVESTSFLSKPKNIGGFLDELYINSWYPSFQSNMGRFYYTFKQLIEEEYKSWIYSEVDLKVNFVEGIDDDDDYFDDDLDIQIDDVLEDFMLQDDFSLYYQRVLKKIEGLG